MERTHPSGHSPRTLALPMTVLVVISIIAAIGFAALAENVRETGGPLQMDLVVRRWAQANQIPSLHLFFRALTWAGSIVTLLPLSLAVAAYLWKRRVRHVIAPVVVAPWGAAVLVELLKAFFRRARPSHDLAASLGYSFPSGHTTAATAVFLTIAYVLIREKLVSRAAAVVAVILAIVIGASRVYLDVHWASDVAGGWAFGSLLAASCALLYERARTVDTTI